jgi:hypothetical protein
MDRPQAYSSLQQQQQTIYPSHEGNPGFSAPAAPPLNLKSLRNSREFEPTIGMKARVMVNTVIDDFKSLFATAAHRNLQHRQCKYNGHVLPTIGYYSPKLNCVECGAAITSTSELRETDEATAMYKNRTAGTGNMVDFWVDESAVRHERRDGRHSRRLR